MTFEHFLKRQVAHAKKNPLAEFEFKILGKAKPGTSLDVLEETFIRKTGIPSTLTRAKNGTGTLSNKRAQMSKQNYRAAGGTQPLPEGS